MKRRLPAWVANVAYAIASVGLGYQLWRVRDQGMGVVPIVIILVLSFCLMKLSYIPFPRRAKVVKAGLPGVEPDYYPPPPEEP